MRTRMVAYSRRHFDTKVYHRRVVVGSGCSPSRRSSHKFIGINPDFLDFYGIFLKVKIRLLSVTLLHCGRVMREPYCRELRLHVADDGRGPRPHNRNALCTACRGISWTHILRRNHGGNNRRTITTKLWLAPLEVVEF